MCYGQPLAEKKEFLGQSHLYWAVPRQVRRSGGRQRPLRQGLSGQDYAARPPVVHRLITIGSPHSGTEISKISIGHPTRELMLGSPLLARLAAAPAPTHTKVTVIWSRGDALVPGARQLAYPNAEVLTFPDLGHVGLLASRRVARTVIARIRD